MDGFARGMRAGPVGSIASRHSRALLRRGGPEPEPALKLVKAPKAVLSRRERTCQGAAARPSVMDQRDPRLVALGLIGREDGADMLALEDQRIAADAGIV